MKNIAVILAGGTGKRFGYDKPKQFLKIAGKMIIEHTIEVFQKHSLIDEICIVVHKNFIDLVEDLVIKNSFNKVRKVLIGGNERYISSITAINAYKQEGNVNLIFHDAVRPLINSEVITECINALKKFNAVDVAIDTADTIIEVEDNFVKSIPPRDNLKRGQTPQAFKLNVIKKAYDIALKDPDFTTTDDCGVVKKYLPYEPIYIVKGEEENIKLTYPVDEFLIDKLFQIRKRTINKHIDLFNLKNKTIVVFGGSSGIGKAIVEIALKYNAKVISFSRKENNTNIKNVEDVKKALKYSKDKYGIIDYVINTAAILEKGALADISYETINEIIDINYKGSIIIAKESFKYLKDSKGKLILFTSSSYTKGRSFYSLYSSTKAAIVNLVQALAEEWEYFGVKISCINPERTDTPMRVKNFGVEDKSTLLKAEEVAKKTLESLLLDSTGDIIDVKNM